MKKSILISVVTAVVLSLILTVIFNARVSGERLRSEKNGSDQQWEYLIVAGGNVNLSSIGSDQFSNLRKQPDGSFKEGVVVERNFDKLGAKGWELVAVYGAPNDPVYYFKRPKEVK